MCVLEKVRENEKVLISSRCLFVFGLLLLYSVRSHIWDWYENIIRKLGQNMSQSLLLLTVGLIYTHMKLISLYFMGLLVNVSLNT